MTKTKNCTAFFCERHWLLAVVGLAVLAPPLQAQRKPANPYSAVYGLFVRTAQFGSCKVLVSVGTMAGNSSDKCVAAQSKGLDSTYQAAMKSVPASKVKARDAIKELYIYLVASIDQLTPLAGENSSAYDRRLSPREAGLSERETRVKVELGLPIE